MQKTILVLFISIMACTALVVPLISLAQGSSIITENELDQFIKKPNPRINIPGLKFSESVVKKETDPTGAEATYFYFPYMGEYLAAIYRYSIVAAGVIAVVMIINNGLKWAISGGSSEKISEAKTRIQQVLMGLFVMVLSYFILYAINPNLVEFRSLKVLKELHGSEMDILMAGGMDEQCKGKTYTKLEHCGITSNNQKVPTNTYDTDLKNFAACGNFDWRLFKGMLMHESGFKPYAVNCACFRGIFQFKKDTIYKTFNKYGAQLGMDTTPMEDKNDIRIFDARLQMMGMTRNVVIAKNAIYRICSKEEVDNMTNEDVSTLIYLKHNSGGKSLTNTLEGGGCAGGEAIEKGLINSWTKIFQYRWQKNGHVYGEKYADALEATMAGQAFGEGKAESVRKAGNNMIEHWGVEKIFEAVPGAGTCPVTFTG